MHKPKNLFLFLRNTGVPGGAVVKIAGWGAKIVTCLGVKQPKHKTEAVLEQIQ